MTKQVTPQQGRRNVNYIIIITHIGICYGLSPLKTIYKDFVHFHFQFEVDFTFNDIKVKNVLKNNQYTKICYVVM